MAGPAQQVKFEVVVPDGEAQKIVAPQNLAWRIVNMEGTNEGTIRSVLGPVPIEPLRDVNVGYPQVGRPFGLFFANLLGGIAPTLILRAAGALYRQAGWLSRTGGVTFGWEQLVIGLNNEQRPRWPDQMLALHDRIIWTNGVDRARVIAHDGLTIPLGFDTMPSAPQVIGPELPVEGDRHTLYPNSSGYSWPGRVGSVGDVLDGGHTGTLLAGRWFYWQQWEDVFGNLSPLSPASAPVKIHSQSLANPFDDGATPPDTAHSIKGVTGVEIDDLLRQFGVYIGGSGTAFPVQAVATWVHRSMDAARNPKEPRLLDRYGGVRSALYPDKKSDAELGSVAVDAVPVPVFRTMCTHQGSLVIANTPDDPSIVRRSQPGFEGTFARNDWIRPDSGGAEVTAVASHAGRLFAFTDTSTYDITDFGAPQNVSRSIGCVAPRSIAALPSGLLVWLGMDGFYGMPPGGMPQLISTEIDRTVIHRINWARVRMAVAGIDPRTGEYRCALASGARPYNHLMLVYNGRGWKEQDLGIDWADLTATGDWPRYFMGCGVQINNGQNNVWVLDHESAAYTPPVRTAEYWSGWLRADGTGLAKVNVRGLYVGFVDGSNGTATIDFFKDGSWAVLGSQTDFVLVGTDESTRVVTDVAGSAVVGTSLVHERRMRWRWVAAPDDLQNVESWAFRIRTTYPARMELAGFAFDVSKVTGGSDVGRIPGGNET